MKGFSQKNALHRLIRVIIFSVFSFEMFLVRILTTCYLHIGHVDFNLSQGLTQSGQNLWPHIFSVFEFLFTIRETMGLEAFS